MVVITVAIASCVFVYVSGIMDTNEIPLSGNITEKLIFGCSGYNSLSYWFILDNSFEIKVEIVTYYNYTIGDYYIEVQ